MKKKVFLTGATGHMGIEGLKSLLEKSDDYDVTVLVLPTERDRKIIAPYKEQVKIVYGDLTSYNDVLECVTGADYVLHVGGMVSPAADYHPELTIKVNTGSVRNIIRAIKAQPDPDRIKLVYIGSVAQTGDRNPPLHWGRTGDPIFISDFDNYALSKVLAEREVIESGLKYWVSLRQTGILYPEMLDKLDPIMFHEPLNGVLEWVTAKNSGRLLANVCSPGLPDDFWRRIYNIGGGENYRTMNWQFMSDTFKALGFKDMKKILEPEWFATRNFHGQWFTDSDILESYLHFRSGSVKDFITEIKAHTPPYMKIVKFIPSSLIKELIFKPVAKKPLGPLYWREHSPERMEAYFGPEKFRRHAGWEDFQFIKASKTPSFLDHGYDETKPVSELDIEDMKSAASFRGGKCLSATMDKGDMNTPLEWECAFGHRFSASPALVLLGGHWCPECLPKPWNYGKEAERNPFLAQVWYPSRGEKRIPR